MLNEQGLTDDTKKKLERWKANAGLAALHASMLAQAYGKRLDAIMWLISSFFFAPFLSGLIAPIVGALVGFLCIVRAIQLFWRSAKLESSAWSCLDPIMDGTIDKDTPAL